ncbi:MAG: NAD(P)-dependent oxidoreductase [Variovorax sp.]|nr:NAD(P)-dependent oxidoreductase [Variovorax sp.]
MRILLTGATSFTGLWFAQKLRAHGHEVVATLRGSRNSYEGPRGHRVRMLDESGVEWVECCSFGDERFLALLASEPLDVICHHAAQVGDYRSLDFDIAQALQANTLGARRVFELMAQRGIRAMVATGSVFEPGEGAGSDPGRAFSPYGLSKGLSWEVLRHWGTLSGVPLHKFIIANPFGPWEEPRFCAYLMRTWAAGGTATVATPSYVRDNIHVSLLADCYADFVARCTQQQGTQTRCAPAGYVESQGSFAQRFAKEISVRLNIAAPLELAMQAEFPEPFMRTNTDRVDAQRLGWNEAAAWDMLADYYGTTYLAAR